MAKRSMGKWVFGVAAALLAISSVASPAGAQDFFSALFGAFGARPPPPQIRTPFPGDDMPRGDVPPTRVHGSGQAWCVRDCDGRHFPAQGADNESKAQSCKSFCPASETTLVYGSDIEDATTANGKPYSELPNAFRYRDELVQGCTCNGKDPVGLARVKVENDPTLRKGDIVAGSDGLMVANRSAGDRRGAAMNFSPLPEKMRAKFRHVPVVARE
ncbi:DUF2865 domain-containing protein [Bradyrhizobium sp.]|uniref:DUF2865 domain-containing protein n=1 Tax=Bradyrhizobium sp. TaxID=376 RepID=UPI00238AC49A|nr:DUF2865 domain-containing protein [Bradyrhizobium sp.]MDE2376187.1 DUF2865 domain-containing protein [Bradyrhizobium sp.]